MWIGQGVCVVGGSAPRVWTFLSLTNSALYYPSAPLTAVPRKGKTQKHSAKEIAGKHKAAKERAGAAGGGGAGAAARVTAQQKALGVCKVCKTNQPSIKSMQIHFEAKHPKLSWEDAKAEYEDMFAEIKSEMKGDGAVAKVRMTKEQMQQLKREEEAELEKLRREAMAADQVGGAAAAVAAMSFGAAPKKKKKKKKKK